MAYCSHRSQSYKISIYNVWSQASLFTNPHQQYQPLAQAAQSKQKAEQLPI